MAYGIPWDEAAPSGATTPADTIDTELQNLKISIRERIEQVICNWSDDNEDPKALCEGAFVGAFAGRRAVFSADGSAGGAVSASFVEAKDVADLYYIQVQASFPSSYLATNITVDLLDIDPTLVATELAVIAFSYGTWAPPGTVTTSGLTFTFSPRDLIQTIWDAAADTITDRPLDSGVTGNFEFWVAAIV